MVGIKFYTWFAWGIFIIALLYECVAFTATPIKTCILN